LGNKKESLGRRRRLEMSESEGQRNDSPLLSERGVTTISDTVVSQLAGMAAQEVEGVHMGGGASRTAGGVLESLTGSESKTSGISVEVGRTETAIDLKMGIEYNRNILQTVEEVRQRITARVEEMTGLRIKELNATITDITFPEKEARRRLGPARPASDREDNPEAATAPETQATPESETSEPDEPEIAQDESTQAETTQAETTQVETAGGAPAEDEIEPEQEVAAEDRPPEESATTEVRTEDQPADEASEAPEESETSEESRTRPEPETPEARMRRRAEERARRRRRRSEDS
jgi:uncharacterized alkaline shock family protein YloU